MSLSYRPLWVLLASRGLNKSELSKITGISPPTISKLAKNEYVSSEILERICRHMKCQIEDVVKYEDEN